MTSPAARWRALCLVTGVVFFGLAVAVALARPVPLPGDVSIREAVLGCATPVVTAVAHWVNYGGSWQGILPAVLLLFALSPQARRRWWLWCAILVLASGAETGVKHLVARPRPEDVSMGFPSGHSTGVATFGIILVYLAGTERLGAGQRVALRGIAFLAMALVGLARLVLHAHWPSDVAGGWLLGTVCASAGAWWDATHGSARDPSPVSGTGPRG